MSSRLSPRFARAYVAVGVLAIGLYFADPRLHALPVWMPRYPLYISINASAVVAIIFGVRRNRPHHVLPWVLIAIGQASYTLGDFLFYRAIYITHSDRFPSIADVFYLGRVPFMIAGLALIVRRHSGHDRAAVIDSLIVATSVSLLSWVFLMKPFVLARLGLAVRLTSLAYPATDLMLVVVALRLVAGRNRRGVSFQLLTGGLMLIAATDSYYGWLTLHGISYHPGSPVVFR